MDIREKMLPVLRPYGGKEEVEALREVIESGWWGNSLLGGEIGSYLYTLNRSPLNQNTADEAALFTREALSWLDEDPKILTCIEGNKLQLQLNLKGEQIDI